MMTHIDEGTIQAYLDGELRLDERRRAELHLESCERCRRALEEQRRAAAHFTAAVEWLDGVPPAAGPVVVEARRPNRTVVVRRIIPRAAVLLLFAGAASATVPGSPVRRWVTRVAGDAMAPRPAAPAAVIAEPAPVAAPPLDETGVSVEALDGRVEVVLRDARDVVVRARLVDRSLAGVYAGGPAAGSSRFVTSAGRIEVQNARGGEVRIELPVGVPRATIVINGTTVLTKAQGRLDLDVGAAARPADGVEFSVIP